MRTTSAQHALSNRTRHGLTILEIVGCLLAVGGGLWLGALYLGVDMPSATYRALSESQLLDKMPESWRPELPQENAVTREQLEANLRDEFGALRTQIAALRNGEAPKATSDAAPATVAPPSTDVTKEQTLGYWLRLTEISLGETALQSDAELAFNADNAAKVFAIKGRICRFAAKAVEAVPTSGVDGTAIRFGRTLQQWYDRGGDLYEQATRIWETPIGPQARTQLNQEWKQAEEHHRNEARLLHQKSIAARGSLGRLYGEDFPEFAKPIQLEAN
jgi:hypothetical protein